MSGYGGNGTFANILGQLSQWETNSTSLTAIIIALSIVILSATFGSASDDKIQNMGVFYLITAWRFFSKRYDFLREHFEKTGVKMFRFRLLQHRLIAMAGEANRKIFFNNQNLDLSEGYRILLGGAPNVRDIINVNADTPQDTTESFRLLLLLLRKERVNDVLPLFLEDINRRMKDWGAQGKMNPFNEVYDLVFQTTVRMATCTELSEDKEAVSRLAKHYWNIEKSTTTVSVLFPWFPGPAKIAKQMATMALYTTLLSYINIRRKASPSTDPIDLFISQGASDRHMVETIMSIIFAGVINTGINACWALLHLGTNPKWKRKANDEYEALLKKYTNTTSSDPLHTRLATIPMIAWEDELPSLDLIIRETLRLSGSMTAFRRNVGKDIQAGETTIKRGDFLVYSIGDANLNPDIYMNPMTFDPDRYGPGREEDRKETFGYLAWGAGRHTCPGMRVAKLEIGFGYDPPWLRVRTGRW